MSVSMARRNSLPWPMIVLIGATTQNPYFSLNPALLSRSMVFELKPLEAEDIKKILCRACTDVKRGLGAYQLEVTQEAIDHLTNCSQGDARIALNRRIETKIRILRGSTN